jgi:drug/metabolite transporter (DMT)-like permease
LASRGEQIRADVTLLVVAAVWGSAFVAQRMGMEQIGPFAFNATRFALGGLVLLPIYVVGTRFFGKNRVSDDLRGGVLLGLLLFGGASAQQIGLVHTDAGRAGFITGLYVVIVPLLLALVWRERAVAGAFLWASHVIAIGRIAPGRDPLRLAMVQYFVCAILSLLAALALERRTWDGILLAGPAIVFTGVLSTALGYTTQVIAQRHTPPTHAAIILSTEAVFAAFFGWLLLGERLTPQQLVGCGLMLAGMVVAQVRAVTFSSR